LHTVGTFIDGEDARIANVLRCASFLHEAHAAMHLHADAGNFVADIGGESLCHRRQQRRAPQPSRTFGSVARCDTSIATAVA
jgi:hypothetical protein